MAEVMPFSSTGQNTECAAHLIDSSAKLAELPGRHRERLLRHLRLRHEADILPGVGCRQVQGHLPALLGICRLSPGLDGLLQRGATFGIKVLESNIGTLDLSL